MSALFLVLGMLWGEAIFFALLTIAVKRRFNVTAESHLVTALLSGLCLRPWYGAQV